MSNWSNLETNFSDIKYVFSPQLESTTMIFKEVGTNMERESTIIATVIAYNNSQTFDAFSKHMGS